MKDFNVNFNQAPTLTGNSGNVMSLKSGNPDIGTFGKSDVTPIALTVSGCDNCLLGGLPPSQACAETCCNEKPDKWCDHLCANYPSTNNPHCAGGAITGITIWDKVVNFFKAIWEAIVDLYHRIFTGKTEKCDGERLNPDKECCKGKKVYSDKIKNLADCPPPRYQKIALPTEGSCGGGILEPFTLDNPTGGENTSFRVPCYMHDRDYATCNSGSKSDDSYREAADIKFHKRMLSICNSGIVDDENREPCRDWADDYYNAVYTAGGSFYRSAQLKYCKCCP